MSSGGEAVREAFEAFLRSIDENYRGQLRESREEGFRHHYDRGLQFDLKRRRWVKSDLAERRTAMRFGDTGDAAEVFRQLTSPDVSRSFCQFYEMLLSESLSDKEQMIAVIEKHIPFRGRSIDDVRHELKGYYRQVILDHIFPQGENDPTACHRKLRRITAELNPSDKGNLTEAWLARYRERFSPADAPSSSRRRGNVTREPSGEEPRKLSDDPIYRSRFGTSQTDQQYKDYRRAMSEEFPTFDPDIRSDRSPDWIVGGTLNEIKAIDGGLSEHDKSQFEDNLRIVGGAAIRISVNGIPYEEPISRIRYTFSSPSGILANYDWIWNQLSLWPFIEFELFDEQGERQVFSQRDPLTLDELQKFVYGKGDS